jgi:hypothetical protein
VNKILQLAVILIFLPILLIAQVEINGTLDLSVSQGGKNSQFITNELANVFQNLHLSIHQLNLFVFAQVTDDFFVNVRLQWDTWGTGKLNREPRLSLAVISWEPEESSIGLSVGRFISPFGLYPRRILSADNLFAHAPLGYGYFINISDQRGYWPKVGDSGIYGPDDVGLTTVYFGGYNTGFMLNWVIVPNLFSIDAAITNAAISSQSDYTNLANMGGIIRLGFQPIIYWQQGISLSHGSFMQRDGININYDDLEQYSQTVIATDLILAHSYFELSGEFLYSMWQVPMFIGTGFIEEEPLKLQKMKLENYSAYLDFKFEPPFITGAYIAFRYDILNFMNSEDLKDVNSKNFNPWDNDVTRYSVAVGYKFARSVLLKIAYMDQTTANLDPDPEDYVLRAILTVSF